MKYLVIFAVLAVIAGVVTWLKAKPKAPAPVDNGPVVAPVGDVKKPGEPVNP